MRFVRFFLYLSTTSNSLSYLSIADYFLSRYVTNVCTSAVRTTEQRQDLNVNSSRTPHKPIFFCSFFMRHGYNTLMFLWRANLSTSVGVLIFFEFQCIWGISPFQIRSFSCTVTLVSSIVLSFFYSLLIEKFDFLVKGRNHVNSSNLIQYLI